MAIDSAAALLCVEGVVIVVIAASAAALFGSAVASSAALLASAVAASTGAVSASAVYVILHLLHLLPMSTTVRITTARPFKQADIRVVASNAALSLAQITSRQAHVVSRCSALCMSAFSIHTSEPSSSAKTIVPP